MKKYDKSTMKDIVTERQFNILIYIATETAKRHYPPSVREICSALNIKSTSTVHKDISILSCKGFLNKDDSNTRKTRAIYISDEGMALIGLCTNKETGSQNITADSGNDFQEINAVNIPVIGNIAAGVPIFADNNIEDEIPIPSRFMGKGNNFLLRVRGDSMEGVGILNKDYILVEEAPYINNGDVVVALFHDTESEATVKTYYKKNGHVELHPENPDYDIIDGDNAQIIGKVCGVFRYL